MTDSPRPDLVDPAGSPLVAWYAPPAPNAGAVAQRSLAPASAIQPAPSAITEPPVSAPPTPVVTVDSSAAKGLLTSVATGAVRVAGTFLMAHGAMTQASVDAIGPIVVQEIVGTALLVGGQCWASIREWLKHQKVLQAAFADPSNIVVK